MKFKDIENKSLTELNDLLNDLRAESFTLGWKNKTQQQDQTHKIRLVRRDIARVLTAMKQIEQKAKPKQKTKVEKKVTSTKPKKETKSKTTKKTAKTKKEIDNGTTN